MSRRIDFKTPKVQVSIQDIVEQPGLDLVRKGDHLNGNCPFKNHAGDRNSKSFSVNTAKDIYICPTYCRSGVGCIDFYCDLMGFGRHTESLKAAVKLKSMFSIPRPKSRRKRPLYQSSKSHHKPLNSVKNIRLDLDYRSPYLLTHKKLMPATIDFSEAGQARMGTLRHHIAILMHNIHGQPIGYAGQNLDMQQWNFTSINLSNCSIITASKERHRRLYTSTKSYQTNDTDINNMILSCLTNTMSP